MVTDGRDGATVLCLEVTVLVIDGAGTSTEATMKPLWWNKFQMGLQIKKGDTIWDEVTDDLHLIPLEALEETWSARPLISTVF